MKRVVALCAILVFFTSLLILPATPGLNIPALAQTGVSMGNNNPPVTQVRLEPPTSGKMQLPAPTLRTTDQMLSDQATHAVPRPPADAAPGGAIPFRPGMDPAQYKAAKDAAKRAPGMAPSQRSQAPQIGVHQNVAVGTINADGEDQTTAGAFGVQFFPPDTDGAVGITQFAQVTNTHFTVWSKATAAKLFDTNLNSFVGYFGAFLFDARVVHDDVFSRWIVSADAFPDSSGAQFQFLAVSVSEDATGPYFIFAFNTRSITCPTCFWDFPQLGIDTEAVILTANIFNPGFAGGRWLFLNKLFLYFGLGVTGCFFFGGVADLPSTAPPKVLDLNPVTWMAEAPPVSNALFLTQFTATGEICPIVLSVNSVAVPFYSVPPNAPQPPPAACAGSARCASPELDTLDARFQNRSVQVGLGFFGQTELWNVHTIPFFGFFGLATPRYYRIKLTGAGSPSIAEMNFFFASGTSSDFNPSIAVNFSKTIAVNWSSTDTPSGLNAQVRVGAKANGGAFGQTTVFQSSVPLLGNGFGSPVQRWGDYSSIATDPTNGGLAWGVNEEINNPDDSSGATWGSRFYDASIP